MGRATDSREILIAEALGDFQVLLERIDALLPRLEAASDRMERSASALVAGIEPLRSSVANMITTEREKALAEIAASAGELALRAHQRQVEAMRASAREVFRTEVIPPLRELGASLRQAHRRAPGAKGLWRALLYTAALSATGGALLVACLASTPVPTPGKALNASACVPEPAPQGSAGGRGRRP